MEVWCHSFMTMFCLFILFFALSFLWFFRNFTAVFWFDLIWVLTTQAHIPHYVQRRRLFFVICSHVSETQQSFKQLCVVYFMGKHFKMKGTEFVTVAVVFLQSCLSISWCLNYESIGIILLSLNNVLVFVTLFRGKVPGPEYVGGAKSLGTTQ